MTMELNAVYERFRRRPFPTGDARPERFWAPILVRPDSSWETAEVRIAFVGQEPLNFPVSPDKLKGRLDHLNHFFEVEDSVRQITRAYDTVEETLARGYTNGSFWQDIRFLRDHFQIKRKITSLVWTNVIHCALDGASDCKLSRLPQPHREPYLAWQNGLLSEELNELKPSLVLFMCSSGFDDYLGREFADLTYSPVGNYTLRQVARLSAASLICPAYRTYHPTGLRRQGLGRAAYLAMLSDAGLD